MKNSIRVTAVLSIAVLLLSLLPSVSLAAETSKTSQITEASSSAGNDYGSYLAGNSAAPKAADEINLSADSAAEAKVTEKDGQKGVLIGEESTSATWKFSVKEASCYSVYLNYYALEGKGKDIEFSLLIDGKIPFQESGRITLSRIWTDETEIKRDANGNDLRPSQVEKYRWNSRWLQNGDGYYEDPYSYYFTAGEHTITLQYGSESMAVSALILKNPEKLKSYTEYSKGASQTANYREKFQAEKTAEKSSSMLYPTYDRSTPATEPSHYSRIRLNTIGQTNWEFQGQWIKWNIEAPEDGWYHITFKARQNYQQGLNSYRTMYVDGKIPFEEAKNIKFSYQLGWYMQSPTSDGEPCMIYLTKGSHELTLEVSAGPMAEVLKSLNDAVLDLNNIYRSIIMVTSTTPDLYRTYYLEDEIPGLMDRLKASHKELQKLYDKVKEITGTGGSQASIIKEMAHMVQSLIDKPLDIPSRISGFKDNIESLGSLILQLSSQPLELDYIVLSSNDRLPAVNATLAESISFNFKAFVASFVEDYNSIGNTYDDSKAVTVWISNGRDQSQILKNMIDDLFTPETGIKVNLSIVSTASGLAQSPLVQATLAGKGPDVALFTPKDTPVNLAMRGALVDLSKFDGFDELYRRFYKSAWIPYSYEGGYYAVPETQNFDVMFYRTDIFKELGLSVPETWDDFYKVLAALQKKNLQAGILETNTANAGISSGISIFEKLLLQNGGTYYNSSLTATAFDTQVAYDAFTHWTELYTEYGLDRSFDFFNRFRTGEMPIGIMNYVTYNQLYVAAPEIRGLWSFCPIPGTKKADGTIDRTETAAGTSAVLLNSAKNKDAAFQFISWWTSTEVQTRYGNELEAILGVAARYDTANIKAFDNLAWSAGEAAIIKKQWNSVTDIMQIPGNYFIARCITNAFRTVVDESENPVSTLNSYNKDMNAEITRKRKEFGLIP